MPEIEWRDAPTPTTWQKQYRVDSAARLPGMRSFILWYATGRGATPDAATADMRRVKALREKWFAERQSA